jgi:hypothetical protein
LWNFLPSKPVALTEPIGDSALASVVREGNRVFVGTTNDNDPSPDPTWRVRVIKEDLSDLGTSQVVMKRPQGVSLSSIGIAIGSGHRGGIAWDDAQGCRFVELGADGAAITAPHQIANSWCYWPVATQSGFIAFNSPSFTFTPVTLLTMNKHGHVTKTRPDIVTPAASGSSPAGLARFDDGTLLVTWSDGNGVTGQHIDASGNTLAPAAGMSISGPNPRFALGSMGSSALGVESGGAAVVAEPFDEDGQHSGPPNTFTTSGSVGHVAVARARGAALVAWSEGPSGAYHVLRVQPVHPDGSTLGAPVVASTLPFIGSLRVVGTSTGALVVFEAEKPGTLTQVFAVRLVCQ